MISKGCLYHIVRVQDLDSKIPPIESLLVVNDFLEAFPNELPGIPPKWEIDFCINFLPETYPISMPLNWIAQAKLKKLMAQLKNLLENGFIRPCTSP